MLSETLVEMFRNLLELKERRLDVFRAELQVKLTRRTHNEEKPYEHLTYEITFREQESESRWE